MTILLVLLIFAIMQSYCMVLYILFYAGDIEGCDNLAINIHGLLLMAIINKINLWNFFKYGVTPDILELYW